VIEFWKNINRIINNFLIVCIQFLDYIFSCIPQRKRILVKGKGILVKGKGILVKGKRILVKGKRIVSQSIKNSKIYNVNINSITKLFICNMI